METSSVHDKKTVECRNISSIWFPDSIGRYFILSRGRTEKKITYLLSLHSKIHTCTHIFTELSVEYLQIRYLTTIKTWTFFNLLHGKSCMLFITAHLKYICTKIYFFLNFITAFTVKEFVYLKLYFMLYITHII